MRKRTSRIYPDGITECNEVYAPFSDGWQYCDAIYKCDENGTMTCLWEKINDTFIGFITNAVFSKWKNELYALADVLEITSSTSSKIIINNALFKYVPEKEGWMMISEEFGTSFGYSAIGACDNGIAFFHEGNYGYMSFENTKFMDFSGNLFSCPTSDIEFLSNTYGNNYVLTNKGVFENDGNLYEYYNTFSSEKTLIIQGSSIITKCCVHDGYIYGYRYSKEVLNRREVVRATISDGSINVVPVFYVDATYSSGHTEGSEIFIDCWPNGRAVIATTEEYGASNTVVKRNYYDATTGEKLFSYDTKKDGKVKGLVLLAVSENKEIAFMESVGYETRVNIHKKGKIIETIPLGEAFYQQLDRSDFYMFSLMYNKEKNKNELYYRCGKVEEGMTVTDVMYNQNEKVYG